MFAFSLAALLDQSVALFLQGGPPRQLHEEANYSWPAMRPFIKFVKLYRDLTKPILDPKDPPLDHICSFIHHLPHPLPC
jgi:hypothetical protein